MKRVLLAIGVAGIASAVVCASTALDGRAAVGAPSLAPPASADDATRGATVVPERSIVDQDAPYREACARERLTASECVGRLIWFKATGGNERFHAYTFPQRIGVLIDWYRVLRSDRRDDRFHAWGLVNDPSCCRPGDAGCPAKSADETYGFDWCPGDDVLLKYVGRSGYVDPACGLADAPLDPADPHTAHGTLDQRQSPCDLRFGTSTGALGLRKFPNPSFDAERWRALNGGTATWDGFDATLAARTGIPSDARVSRLADASYEPPFLIGITCGSCHIAFDPANPPRDPAHPEWANIKGLVGNQYTRMTEVLGSGMATTSLEWQMFAHPRPGVVDTSAIPHDQVNDPGTVNAIVNFSQRPTFRGETITKWRKADRCGAGDGEARCWCEPGRVGKCWRFETRTDDATTLHVGGRTVVRPGVPHLLKGGEDSIGLPEALLRVYFNIGACAEQCWANHLTDFRQLDPTRRGFGETPFDVAACRRDCPSFRAIEDRLDNLVDFVASPESDATDLYVARDNERKRNARGASKPPPYTRNDLVRDLEREFGRGAVARGRAVFAENCARCHSSIPESVGGPFESRDFDAVAQDDPRRPRADFLGNDEATAATEVGTFRCRALHSNHMAGHVFGEFASDTLHARAIVADITERDALKDGGRGYYRNVSLVNVWASAPFMHNNAIGPELCGKPADARNDFFRPRYVDADGRLLAKQPACTRYDPSVEGRFALYERSMAELLNPGRRGLKATLTTDDVVVDVGVRTWDGREEKPLVGTGSVRIPKGTPAGLLNGLMHKALIADVYAAMHDEGSLAAKGREPDIASLRTFGERLLREPASFSELFTARNERLLREYETCAQTIENEGHRFGESLSEADKKALTAFLATM